MGSNVNDLLDRLGVAHKLHRHTPVRNAAEAAQATLDFDLSLLVKTLVFRMPAGWLLAVLRAQDQVVYSALAKAAGVGRRDLRFATEEDLQSGFGWEPGGASPVTQKPGVRVLVEERVFGIPHILFGGGTRNLTIEAKPADLFARITHQRASFAK